MVITSKDVEADLSMVMQSIEDKNRPLTSPWKVLKLSMLWPMSCALCYMASVMWTVLSYKPYVNHFDRVVNVFDEYGINMGFALVSIFMALLVGAGLYGNALIYLSVDSKVRRKSLIFTRVKGIAIKLGIVFFVLNLSLAVMAANSPGLLLGAPFMFVASVLIIGFVINAEIARYGTPSLLAKLSKVVKKI